MTPKASEKSGSSLLLVLLVILTFPFWIGIFAMVAGSIGGAMGSIFGTVFGTIGGLMGAFFGILTWPVKALFGHGPWFPHINGYTIAVIVILVYLVSKNRKGN